MPLKPQIPVICQFGLFTISLAEEKPQKINTKVDTKPVGLSVVLQLENNTKNPDTILCQSGLFLNL